MPLMRCKCGRWTNYGIFCFSCRQDAFLDEAFDTVDDFNFESDSSEEEPDVESLDELEEKLNKD